MTIGSPYLVGTATGSGVSSLTITPQTPTAPGDTIIICTDSDLQPTSASPSGVTDSGGNTYLAVPVPMYTINPAMAMWVAEGNTAALSTASTITVTWSASTDISAVAAGCTGLAPFAAVDQAAWRYTTNKGLSLTTGYLSMPGELAIAYWASRQAQGAPVIKTDWSSFAAFQGAAGTHYVNMAWKILPTASSPPVSATTPSAGTGWAGMVATFRPRVNPTATLSCGGSLLAYPVQPVSGTATLGCGGSLLGPAELGPQYPPASPVFPAGYQPVPADMAGWVRAGMRYATEQAVFRAEQTVGGGQSLPNSGYTTLAYDSVLEDPFGGWSATSTSLQAAHSWLCPSTGLYRVTARYCSLPAACWHDMAVGVSGVVNQGIDVGGMLSTSSVTGGASCSVLVPLIGGADYVQVLAFPSVSITTDTTTPGRRPSVEITSVQTELPG